MNTSSYALIERPDSQMNVLNLLRVKYFKTTLKTSIVHADNKAILGNFLVLQGPLTGMYTCTCMILKLFQITNFPFRNGSISCWGTLLTLEPMGRGLSCQTTMESQMGLRATLHGDLPSQGTLWLMDLLPLCQWFHLTYMWSKSDCKLDNICQ